MSIIDRLFRKEAPAAPAAERVAPTIRNDWLSSDSGAMAELFNVQPAATGFAVNETSAMRVSAVYACVQLIAGSIASLPAMIYQRADAGRKALENHPLFWLLNEAPTASFTAASAWEFWVKSYLLGRDGSGYGLMVRNSAREVIEIIPLHPSCVLVQLKDGELRYFVDIFGTYTYVAPEDMLHFAGFGFDGIRAPSVIASAAKQAVGIALATDEYSGKFFQNGAAPKVFIKSPGKMTDDQVEQLRTQWQNRMTGPDNSHKPLILTQGLDATEMSISPEDSQLLDARGFQVIDIARAFGVPPHMIGETTKTSSWGSGVESMSIGFVKYTLQFHLNRIEQEVNRKIWPQRVRTFMEFNVDGLQRGDSAAKATYYRNAIGGSNGPGWMTADEIRHIDNLPPMGGDSAKLYDPAKNGATNEPTAATAAG